VTSRSFIRGLARTRRSTTSCPSSAVALTLALIACSVPSLRAQSAPEPPRAQAPAEPRRPDGPPADRQAEDRWWRDHALLPRLDLEPARRARLEDTYAAARARLDTLNAAAIAAETELAAVTHAVDPDERDFAPRLERMVAAHEQFENEHAGLLLTVRGLLTPAQWGRLHELQRTLGGPGPAGGPPRAPAGGGDPRHRPPPGPAPGGERSDGGPPLPDDAPRGRGPAGPPLPPGTWWRDPEAAARFGIERHQVDDLDAAFEARKSSLAGARTALEREERALGALLPSPALDLDAALAASRRVAHARAQLDRAFLDLRFAQWRLLRADQRERLLHPAAAGVPR